MKTRSVYPSLATSKGVKQLTQYHDLSILVGFGYVLRTKAPGQLAAVTQSLQ